MAEFSAAANLHVQLDDASVRTAKRNLSRELGHAGDPVVEVATRSMAPDGGAHGRGATIGQGAGILDASREQLGLQETIVEQNEKRNELLDDIADSARRGGGGRFGSGLTGGLAARGLGGGAAAGLGSAALAASPFLFAALAAGGVAKVAAERGDATVSAQDQGRLAPFLDQGLGPTERAPVPGPMTREGGPNTFMGGFDQADIQRSVNDAILKGSPLSRKGGKNTFLGGFTENEIRKAVTSSKERARQRKLSQDTGSVTVNPDVTIEVSDLSQVDKALRDLQRQINKITEGITGSSSGSGISAPRTAPGFKQI